MDERALEVKIPTSQLVPLLNQFGAETTWRALIRQLALHSYPHGQAAGVASSATFGSELPQVENLLDGLSIGQIAIMYEFSLAHVDHSSRKASGQYFTPDDVARFLAERCALLGDGVWLDPASGIGNLSYWLAARQSDPEDFVLNRLYLSDRDPLALLIARALFSLLFYRGEEDLFSKLEGRFVLLDFLEGEPPAHDFAILNPPYAARLADERFKSAAARDVYAYFLEKVADTSKGFISITPQSFMNGGKFTGLRQVLLERFNFLRVWSFDNIPDSIFSGVKFGSQNTNTSNSTRAAVMVAKRQVDLDQQVTSLLRWPVAKRKTLLARADEFLVPAPLSDYKFPKLPLPAADLLEEVAKLKPLSSLLSESGAYTLTVPASPRYYISATKRTLSRSSFHTLHFESEAVRDRAYLLINSGLMYWWWRVMDGGMTLSQETLFTAPIAEFSVDPSLVADLEESEVQNLTAKANAGKLNENVKHPTWLRAKLDESLFGADRAAQLRSIATNDDLSYLP